MNPKSTSAGGQGYALCTAGRPWGHSDRSRIRQVSSQEIQRGRIQITCIRCLKIHELNLRSGRVSRKPEQYEQYPTEDNERYPAEDSYSSSGAMRESSSENGGSLGFIIGGVILLIITIAGIFLGNLCKQR